MSCENLDLSKATPTELEAHLKFHRDAFRTARNSDFFFETRIPGLFAGGNSPNYATRHEGLMLDKIYEALRKTA